jgi:hypothetical protein
MCDVMAWVRVACVGTVIRVGLAGRSWGVVEDDDFVDGEDRKGSGDAPRNDRSQFGSRKTNGKKIVSV